MNNLNNLFDFDNKSITNETFNKTIYSRSGGGQLFCAGYDGADNEILSIMMCVVLKEEAMKDFRILCLADKELLMETHMCLDRCVHHVHLACIA